MTAGLYLWPEFLLTPDLLKEWLRTTLTDSLSRFVRAWLNTAIAVVEDIDRNREAIRSDFGRLKSSNAVLAEVAVTPSLLPMRLRGPGDVGLERMPPAVLLETWASHIPGVFATRGDDARPYLAPIQRVSETMIVVDGFASAVENLPKRIGRMIHWFADGKREPAVVLLTRRSHPDATRDQDRFHNLSGSCFEMAERLSAAWKDVSTVNLLVASLEGRQFPLHDRFVTFLPGPLPKFPDPGERRLVELLGLQGPSGTPLAWFKRNLCTTGKGVAVFEPGKKELVTLARMNPDVSVEVFQRLGLRNPAWQVARAVLRPPATP